ncbi:MAG: Holliday junction ATP-dependent DNA helicase RuvB [Candidatus Moranbacteria bacterium GW2011_GWE1_35_17]|nr:MAG: Holliday junction ATP-dependent DNA helicase RuvB [Candidatus Moranbacteria bacterium GW2011_GWE1_35_17]KKP80966.1 MAG: Holliday junction ATP-dependent DNA helicase RuvB [Candidatus Moranbacteria bacterium GW2011_GWF1_35_5]KKP84234.1 MAG: Holliday junction ATP-dependent DNA helicase RuvB [Candidatus Moranbacteria bacterium GW2011_GWF2_35_54]
MIYIIMVITNSKEQEEDKKIDSTLRPQSFNEYIGQERIKKNLHILLSAAKKRNEPVEHILLYGPAGLGKTTLSNIIAKEMNVGIKITSGPAIERVGDLGSILTNLNDGDVLFIDEIHRLNKLVEEILYPAMEDYKLDIIVGKGPSARTLQLDLPHFTLIGATTRLGSISNPLRDRFGAIHKLNFYETGEIQSIIKRSSKILNISVNEEGCKNISACSRQTPRVANRILKRVRDFAQMENTDIIDKEISQQALRMIDIDELGLEPADRDIIRIIIENFKGGPVGIQTIAAATHEEVQTIEDVYEPFLIQCGLLARTPRGRIVTEKGYLHLGYAY